MLHRGFLGEEPSGDSPGTLFEPMQDGHGVDGGWRDRSETGGAPLAALSTAAALPVEMASLSFRMVDLGMTSGARMLEAALPGLRLGPPSR